MDGLEVLANEGANAAMLAAVQYIRQNSLKYDADALVACLRSHCKASLPAALHDFRDAADCHMDQIAISTFRATMAFAGIEAAKEAGSTI